MLGFARRMISDYYRGERASQQDASVNGGLPTIDTSTASNEQERRELEEIQRQQNAHIERNTPAPGNLLPYDANGGWDARTILSQLGQYDRLEDTNSDNVRCVQAAALGSYVLDGPGAVGAFLRGVADALRAPLSPRQAANSGMLQSVALLVSNGEARYADLSLAQEALHDLYTENDAAGTDTAAITGQMTTPGGPTELEPMDVWCSTQAELFAQANALRSGEKLITTVWAVSVNEGFEQLDGEYNVGDRVVVEVQRPDGSSFEHELRKIDTSRKPRPRDLDLDTRDHRQGHQVLVFRDAGGLGQYDPEQSPSGDHEGGIPNAGSLQHMFDGDDPEYGSFRYVQIQGKLKPRQVRDS